MNIRYLASSGKDRSLCLYAHNSTTNTFDTVTVKKSAHKRIVWGCRFVFCVLFLQYCRLFIIFHSYLFSCNSIASWTEDGSHLITVARDGICKVWQLVVLSATEGAQVVDLVNVHSFTPFAGGAVTAVDICRSGPLSRISGIPVVAAGSASGEGVKGCQSAWMVALGAESGDLQVWRVSKLLPQADGAEAEYASQALLAVSEAHAHGATVRRIRWRPQRAGQDQDKTDSSASWEFASCGEDRTVRVHRILI